jgi:hypothetical protein
MKERFTIKDDCRLGDMTALHPALYLILSFVLQYCNDHGLECRITSLASDRDGVISVSTTHEDGRAFDLGIRESGGWSEFHVKRLVQTVNKAFQKIAAVSVASGRPVAAYAASHGTGPHIHFQVKSSANVVEFLTGAK